MLLEWKDERYMSLAQYWHFFRTHPRTTLICASALQRWYVQLLLWQHIALNSADNCIALQTRTIALSDNLGWIPWLFLSKSTSYEQNNSDNYIFAWRNVHGEMIVKMVWWNERTYIAAHLLSILVETCSFLLSKSSFCTDSLKTEIHSVFYDGSWHATDPCSRVVSFSHIFILLYASFHFGAFLFYMSLPLFGLILPWFEIIEVLSFNAFFPF